MCINCIICNKYTYIRLYILVCSGPHILTYFGQWCVDRAPGCAPLIETDGNYVRIHGSGRVEAVLHDLFDVLAAWALSATLLFLKQL